MRNTNELKSISDDELLRRLSELLHRSRGVESDLIAHIAEVDDRRLFAGQACSSMFSYCTDVLHLSEHEAYLRIAAARASRKHPMLLIMLGDGRLHLSGIGKLAPYLTEGNCEAVLARAAHKSKREIEELVAELSPKPDVPASMRKLPVRTTITEIPPVQGSVELGPDRVTNVPTLPKLDTVSLARPVAPPAPAVVKPLAPARYSVQFTASAELRDKLERLKELMRSSVPDGDLAAVLEIAVTEKLERLEAKRFAETKTRRKNLQQTDTSPSSRHIPAAVKRAVRARDGGRCTFADGKGKRCSERRGLEFHHQHPFGRGGDHSPENIQLMCRAHNAYRAERDYGRNLMERYRGKGNRVSEPAPFFFTGSAVARAPGGIDLTPVFSVAGRRAW